MPSPKKQSKKSQKFEVVADGHGGVILPDEAVGPLQTANRITPVDKNFRQPKFAGARLLEPVDRHQHIQFMERRIAGKRLVDAPERPKHIVGEAACREFAQAFPCPQSSYPAVEQGWVDPSLRNWAKSAETHSTDQNELCEFRYNRHIFCSGKIPPAGETTAAWQMEIPRVPEAFPVKTLFERIQREKRLISEQRKSRWLLTQVVNNYENDWRTQAECEDLLRQTKKARLSPYGLPPRSTVKDLDGYVRIPTLKTGKLPKPPEELPSEWDEILYEASKNEPTPLREEIDFYPPSFAESNFDGRERSSGERVSGFEFDGINNNGVRETTREVPNDVNRRSEYQKKYQYVIPYNRLGRGRTEEVERAVRNHPDFLVDAARNEIQMTNATIVEVAERMGIDYDWLRQRLSRGNQIMDMYKTNPRAAVNHEILGSREVPAGFNIGVRLNNTWEFKYLGAVTDSPEQHLKALLRWKKATTKGALKHERKKARKNGWSNQQLAEAEQAARARVEEAYRLPFEGLRSAIEGEGNAVTVST